MAIPTRSSKTPSIPSFLAGDQRDNNASDAINLFMCNNPSFMLNSVHTYIKKKKKTKMGLIYMHLVLTSRIDYKCNIDTLFKHKYLWSEEIIWFPV